MVTSTESFVGQQAGRPPARRPGREGPMGRHRAGDGVRAPWQEGTREALTAVGLEPGAVRDYAIRAVAEELGPGSVDVTAAVTGSPDDGRRGGIVARGGGGVARPPAGPGLPRRAGRPPGPPRPPPRPRAP